MQFIVTWSRRYGVDAEANFLNLTSDMPTFEASLQRALGVPHVISAWVLAAKLFGSNNAPLKRIEAKGYSSYLDAMDDFNFPHTHDSSESRANLICVQGGQREFIRPLYEETKGVWHVRPEGDIRAMTQDILSQMAPNWTAKYLREVCDPLSHLVRELVENSDWWARMDQHGKLYAKGIRATTFRLIDIDDDNVMNFAGANDHLKAYLLHCLTHDTRARIDAPSTRKVELRRLSFVELSMVDSGPGLARRWIAGHPQNKKSVADLGEIAPADEDCAY